MKRKSSNRQHGFDSLQFPATLPRPDYARMSESELLREGRRMYTNLQTLWRTERQMPEPDPEILASVASQMRMMEEGCPEVCRP